MDGRDFDNLLRSLTESRRTVLGGGVGLLSALLGTSSLEAKRKKKKCAKKCPDGCCTSTRGKCIPPAQQNATQCGTGGEICRTNCGSSVPPPPDPKTCGPENCAGGCCAGTTCTLQTNQTCGIGGAACVACGAKEQCFVGKCCGQPGHTCGVDGECCLGNLCDAGTCCAPYGQACQVDADCCQSDSRACENGECVIKTGSACEPLQMCQGNLPCPASAICGECPEGWETCSDGSCCSPDQFCENQGTTARCCPRATGCQA